MQKSECLIFGHGLARLLTQLNIPSRSLGAASTRIYLCTPWGALLLFLRVRVRILAQLIGVYIWVAPTRGNSGFTGIIYRVIGNKQNSEDKDEKPRQKTLTEGKNRRGKPLTPL